MAVQMSPKLLKEFGAWHQPLVHLLIRSRRLRSALRGVERRIRRPPSPAVSRAVPRVTPLFDAAASAFRENGWGFVDLFFDPEFFAELLASWPPRRFFSPMHNALKSYDFGFRWRRGVDAPKFIGNFSALERAYSMLRSPEFSERVTQLCGDGIARSCYSLTCTWATERSALIPHRDTIAKDSNSGSFINIVIFVDANGKAPHAGGTCILADNEYRQIIFEPTKLTNTALFYQSNAEFFHGFKPLAPGAFRWTVIAQYCDVNFTKESSDL
jgi:hypothetical protein